MLTTNRTKHDMDNNNNSKLGAHRLRQQQTSWDSSDGEETIRRERQYFAKVEIELQNIEDEAMKQTAKNNKISRSIYNRNDHANNFQRDQTFPSTPNSDNDSISIQSRQEKILATNNKTLTKFNRSSNQYQPLTRRQQYGDTTGDAKTLIPRDVPCKKDASAKIRNGFPTSANGRSKNVRKPLIRSVDCSDVEEYFQRDNRNISEASVQVRKDLPLKIEKTACLPRNESWNSLCEYIGSNFADDTLLEEKVQKLFTSEQNSNSEIPNLLKDYASASNEQYDDDDSQIFVGSSLAEIELEEKKFELRSNLHNKFDKRLSIDDEENNAMAAQFVNNLPASGTTSTTNQPSQTSGTRIISDSSNQIVNKTNTQTQKRHRKRKLHFKEQQIVLNGESKTDHSSHRYTSDAICSQVVGNQILTATQIIPDSNCEGAYILHPSTQNNTSTIRSKPKPNQNRTGISAGGARQRNRPNGYPRTPEKTSQRNNQHRPHFQSPFRLFLSVGQLVKSGLGPGDTTNPRHCISPIIAMSGSLKSLTHPRLPAHISTLNAFAQYENLTSRAKRHNLIPKQPKPKEDPSLGVAMVAIEHLSKKTIVDGYPVWKIVLHAGVDDVLYCFTVFAQQSGISGGGMGAFLKYTGAKVLNPISKDFNERIFENTTINMQLENQTLQAQFEDGGATVHIKGAGLEDHGRKYCSNHDVVASFRQKSIRYGSIFKAGKQKIRIHIDGIPSSLDRKAYFVEDECRRVGYLGIHLESDYKLAPEIPFPASNESVIDLGRYGPFRKLDRKSDELFHLKNFIFCNEPAEWGFGVEEKWCGADQTVDITDEVTGVPHGLAKVEIPMYVNEVGYNKDLIQNVFICDEEDRVVKYFFKNKESMKNGDTVELLTNYGNMYEATRERKGYGWFNMHGNTVGDDVFAHYLRRNFQMRIEVEYNIQSEWSVQELKECLDFVNRNIWAPLIDVYMIQSTKGANWEEMSPTQMKAVLRIQWVLHRIQQKIESYQQPASRDNLLEAILLYKARQILEAMQLQSSQLRLCQHIKSISGTSLLSKALSEEMTEAVCFDVHEYLPMLFERSIYCAVSCSLISELCEIIAIKCSLCDTTSTESDKLNLNREVFEEFVTTAKGAVNAIRSSILSFMAGVDSLDLCFTNTVSRKCCFTGTIEQGFKYAKQSTSFFLQHSICSKPVLAALVEKIAYFDCVVLGGIEPQWDTYADPLDLPDAVVMVECKDFFADNIEVGLQQIGSIPRSIVSARQMGDSINLTWYILWQVFWPVHVFATTFLDKSVYTIDSLCSELQLPLSAAQYAISKGIDKSSDLLDYTFIPCCTPKEYHTSASNRRTASCKGQKSDQPYAQRKHVYDKAFNKKDKPVIKLPPLCVYEGAVLSFPASISSIGWTQKTFQRQSGASKGSTDNYWFSTNGKYKLRSHKEIERFMEAVQKFNGDEAAAFKYK